MNRIKLLTFGYDFIEQIGFFVRFVFLFFIFGVVRTRRSGWSAWCWRWWRAYRLCWWRLERWLQIHGMFSHLSVFDGRRSDYFFDQVDRSFTALGNFNVIIWFRRIVSDGATTCVARSDRTVWKSFVDWWRLLRLLHVSTFRIIKFLHITILRRSRWVPWLDIWRNWTLSHWWTRGWRCWKCKKKFLNLCRYQCVIWISYAYSGISPVVVNQAKLLNPLISKSVGCAAILWPMAEIVVGLWGHHMTSL